MKKISRQNQKEILGGKTRLQNCQQISPECVFVQCSPITVETICGVNGYTPVWCSVTIGQGGHCVCPPEQVPAGCSTAM